MTRIESRANKTSGPAIGEALAGLEQAPAGAPVPHDGDAAPSTAKAPAGSPAELEERYCEIAARRLAQDTLFGGVA